MATQITYHQITLCPSDGSSEQTANTATIPHVDGGWCQVAGVDFIGGGSERRFLAHVLVFEPIQDTDTDSNGRN